MKKKDERFLLVDGYNIIHSWSELKALADDSLSDARDKLIEILCDYNGYVNDNIILVFDAHLVKGNTGSEHLFNNIYIVYTKEAETADHYIEKCVSRIVVRNYNVSVATSDNLEQVIIASEGAIRISAREFRNQVYGVKKKMREQFLERKAVKENLLFDRLSAGTVEFLEDLRRK